jgi:hypothetical protein
MEASQLLHPAHSAAELEQNSNAERLRLFDQLPLGQQNMLLDLASVAQVEAEKLLPVWRTWHGQQADQWLSELQQQPRLLNIIGLQNVQDIIISNSSSPHYASRIWVYEGGHLVGGHEVRAWLIDVCLAGSPSPHVKSSCCDMCLLVVV